MIFNSYIIRTIKFSIFIFLGIVAGLSFLGGLSFGLVIYFGPISLIPEAALIPIAIVSYLIARNMVEKQKDEENNVTKLLSDDIAYNPYHKTRIYKNLK